MQTLTRLAVLATTALMLFGALAPAASAHAELRDADPPPGGSVSAGVVRIELRLITFEPGEPVEVVVTDPSGENVVRGTPAVSPFDGAVTVDLDPLDLGIHTVRWRAMSSDGDGMSTGTYSFEVEPAPGTGWGLWLLWAVALGLPALVFLRPGARRTRQHRRSA